MLYATKNEWQSYASVLFIRTRKWITFNRFWDYLHCYINWQAVNYRISPRHANSSEIGRMAENTCQNHFTLAFGELGSGGFPHCKNIGGVIVSVPVGYKIGICCFSAEHAALTGLPLLWNQREKWLLFQVLTKEKWWEYREKSKYFYN